MPALFEDLANYLDHLTELRNRLFVGAAALLASCMAGWFLFPLVFPLLAGPILDAVKAHQGQVISTSTTGPLFTRMKLTLITGLILASPVIVWELWAFVRPGLTRDERRAVGPLMPAICVLFLCGAGVAYLMLPSIMRMFLGFFPTDVTAMIDYQHAIDLPSQIMLAFGLTFQLPILVLGLVKLHILTPRVLLSQWRIAVVVIAVIAAIITPTPDPFNMTLLMLPLLALYFGTVLIAFRLEKSAPEGGDAP